MKKLLSMLGAIGLVATSSATVVSCGDKDKDEVKVIALEGLAGDALKLALEEVDETVPPTGDAVLKAFNTKNKDAFNNVALTGEQVVVTVTEATPTTVNAEPVTKEYKATIVANAAASAVVTGTANVTITVTKSTTPPVATAIDLGALKDAALVLTLDEADATVPPTGDAVLAAFNTKNKDAFNNVVLTSEQVVVTVTPVTPTKVNEDPATTKNYTATIVANDAASAVVTGTANVTITVTQTA